MIYKLLSYMKLHKIKFNVSCDKNERYRYRMHNNIKLTY